VTTRRLRTRRKQPWVVLPEGDEVFQGTVRLMRRDRSRPLLFRIFRAIEAGALYAITVFLIGFILGTIRVLLLAPHLGETIAVILEAPLMLAAS
jgi:hypothetical protein